MSNDLLPIAIILGVIAALNVFTLLLLRLTLNRLVDGVIGYRERDAETVDPDSGSRRQSEPLRDAFEQYSALTVRMADLVFRLIDGRSRPADAARPTSGPSKSVLGELAMGVAAAQSGLATQLSRRAGELPVPDAADDEDPGHAATTTRASNRGEDS